MLANDASLQVKSRSDPDVPLTYSVNHPNLPACDPRLWRCENQALRRGSIREGLPGIRATSQSKRLAILDAAPSLHTLRGLPSNRLEVLRGARKGQYSIRINRQWRICFEWPDSQPGPSRVEIVDYH